MTPRLSDDELLRRLVEVRAEALRHHAEAQRLHAERRRLLETLTARGHSQADLARELGVSRQAVQKMLAG
ncbi:MAG: MarR family transcriptional regulator [Frankiales bacterium]|nr:MarR family transcriptional regulator [Frankiales bacterium]